MADEMKVLAVVTSADGTRTATLDVSDWIKLRSDQDRMGCSTLGNTASLILPTSWTDPTSAWNRSRRCWRRLTSTAISSATRLHRGKGSPDTQSRVELLLKLRRFRKSKGWGRSEMPEACAEVLRAERREKHNFEHDVVALIPELRRRAGFLTRCPSTSDDLVQNTVIKALENRDKFQAGTNLRAWMFTIMRHRFLNDIRIYNREQPAAADCASLSCQMMSPPTQEWSLMGRTTMEALRNLPQPYKRTLELILIEGESYEDSARRCGCAMGTIKSRLNRARHMMMDRLGQVSVN